MRLNDSRIIARARSSVITHSFGARAATHAQIGRHASHGVCVYVGLDGDVALESGAGALLGQVLLVAPDVEHAVRAAGPMVVLSYDPELHLALTSRVRSQAPATVLQGRPATLLRQAFVSHRAQLADPAVLAGVGCEAVTWLAQAGAAPRLDRRVARVLESMRELGSSVDEARSGVTLSRAHLAALFARDVGLSMRRYALWQRLLRGVAACAQFDATHAAHAAGFADLAHFSRTSRRLLGLTPSELRQNLLA